MSGQPTFPSLSELTEEAYQQLLANLVTLRVAQEQAAAVVPTVQPSTTLKPPKPEPFRGGRKIASWLFSLEQYFTVVKLQQPMDRVHFAATLLRDAAADWWRGVSIAVAAQNRQPVQDWDDFKQQITKHFQPIDEEDFARQQIRTVKQSGGIREYVVKFQNLILQIPTMDERSRVDAFTAGLHVDARRWVKLQDPRTLEDAMSIAERYQTMLMQDRATLRTYKHLSRGAPDQATPMELGFIGNTKPKPGATTKPTGQSNTVPSCWECGEPGHLRRNCPKRRNKHKKGPRVNYTAAEDSDSTNA